MKNMKLSTRLIIGFLVIDFIMMLSLYCGYTGAQRIVEAADPEKYLSNFAYNTAILFVAQIVVTSGVCAMLLKKVKDSVKAVSGVSKALAAGEVDVEFPDHGNDEFGAMLGDLEVAVVSLHEEAEVAQLVADGNMAVDVTVKSDKDAMGNALKKMVDYNNHTLSEIKEAAYQVTTGASQVASASDALAQGSTEQASAIQQITASIDDVAERTKQNAEQANEAAGLMVQAIEEVKKGNVEMQEMVKAMEAINVASESISKIIKVIDDIAFQTNILALNAAVEAARAGEAGMGFAVVAEEVRNLAAKSASAAAETAEMIEDSIKKVNAGSKIAQETAVALDKITAAVSKSESYVTEIAEASNYQATAIAQIDQAIEQVSQVVQNNSATSEECAAASEELANQAAKMRELVSVYKLKEEEAV